MTGKLFAAAIVPTLLSLVAWSSFAAGRANQIETTVAEILLSHNASDVDGDPLGMALESASTDVSYSLNDGLSWLPFVPVEGEGLLLPETARVRLDQSSSFEHLRIRAWDQTDGVAGTMHPMVEVGGSTAFSSNLAYTLFTNGVDATCDEDLRLQIGVRALSSNGNIAQLTNVEYTVTPPEFGTWQNRALNDPPQVAGYFVPSGQLGACVLSVTGINKKGQQVTPGTLTITVVVGAAQVIVVEDLGEVDQ